jgi:methylmalonyl-CoA mutase
MGLPLARARCPRHTRFSTHQTPIVPPARTRYLAEISDTVRGYKKQARAQARLAREVQQLRGTARMLKEANADKVNAHARRHRPGRAARGRLNPDAKKLLAMWPDMQKAYAGDEYVVKIRDKEIRTKLVHDDAVGHQDPQGRAAALRGPRRDPAWLMLENVPGSFPYTAGVFAFKREGEDPTRMFAGEGDAFRTNRRFKLVSEGMPAKRLSTAFDSVTLYGADPDRAPTSTARSATPACRSRRWRT